LIHNDLSVLENHHAYTTFRILRQQKTNIFQNLRKDTFQSLKKMIVGAIMATDMVSKERCSDRMAEPKQRGPLEPGDSLIRSNFFVVVDSGF
jgi:hypothetical protein